MSFDEVLNGYAEELHDLPEGIREKLNEIRELDEFVEAKRHELKSRVRRQISARRAHSKELEDIEAEYDDLEQLSKRKFHLANETYELVDQYICKLDNQTQEFQCTMRKRFSEACSRLEPGTSFETTPKAPKKRQKPVAIEQPTIKEEVREFKSVADATGLVDMPIDPNEPRYCVCNQVSFGDMVMCDNKGCPVEWFHFPCVGLAEKPRGKWYCSNCTPQTH